MSTSLCFVIFSRFLKMNSFMFIFLRNLLSFCQVKKSSIKILIGFVWNLWINLGSFSVPNKTTFIFHLSTEFFILKLSYNSNTVKFACIKMCIIQWILIYSESCVNITINSKMFSFP